MQTKPQVPGKWILCRKDTKGALSMMLEGSFQMTTEGGLLRLERGGSTPLNEPCCVHLHWGEGYSSIGELEVNHPENKANRKIH